MRILLIGALTLATAGAALAQGYDGTYQLDQCDASNIQTQINVTGFVVDYYESSCTMTNGVAVRDMEQAFLFDGVCSGEGMNWNERVFMQATAQGGLIQVRRGYAYTYVPC